eukprot:TRINITY_DN4816_c0_g4_i1.p1 TRINITY_DN4816_c0_g4~~TRINITY_DN4816_c0_g4_i1.p1  ORF type:complete len:320 (-),score=62.52 TRINITY_DN4816_c0_g4_i1:70-948(-)
MATQPAMQSGGYGPPGVPAPTASGTGGGYSANAYIQGGGVPYGAPPLTKVGSVSDWSILFFVAALCVILGGIISAVDLLFSLQWIDFIEMCYMILFAGVLAIMDTPGFKNMKTVADHRMYFSKYVHILTRLTGKGLCLLFLGCVLFAGMWDNLDGGFLLFLAIVLCAPPTLIGLAASMIGFMKSWKLNKVRQSILEEQGSGLAQTFQQFARDFPQAGLTQREFNDLCRQRGPMWEDGDLKLIFNALVSNPAWRSNHQMAAGQPGAAPGSGIEWAKLPVQDFMAWVQGGWVWL